MVYMLGLLGGFFGSILVLAIISLAYEDVSTPMSLLFLWTISILTLIDSLTSLIGR